MDYSAIHKALKANKYNWVMAAEVAKCTPTHVMNVASRKAQSARVGKILAALVGRPVAIVFPDKPAYQKDKAAERAKHLADAELQVNQALAS